MRKGQRLVPMTCDYVDVAWGKIGDKPMIFLNPKVKGSPANPSPFAIDLACARFLAVAIQGQVREAEERE